MKFGDKIIMVIGGSSPWGARLGDKRWEREEKGRGVSGYVVGIGCFLLLFIYLFIYLLLFNQFIISYC